jgi:hypothetical protein
MRAEVWVCLDPAQHSGKLRYLWNLGIKLDRDPDTLLDEGLEFKPKLFVLDSLHPSALQEGEHGG